MRHTTSSVMRYTTSWFRGAGSIAFTRLAICAALVALAGCGTAHKLLQPGASPSAPPAHSAPSARSAFAVLRAPGSANDVVPSWVARHLLHGNESTFSAADIKDARRVLADQQGWLIPAADDELCLVRVIEPLVSQAGGESLSPSVERSCAGQAQAEQGRLAGTQSLSTTFARRLPTRVVGIVPDGVREVTIHWAGGASTIAVARNAYEDTLINPSSVSFIAAGSGHRHLYVVPLSSVAGMRPTPYQPAQNEVSLALGRAGPADAPRSQPR
jgi:hypothetical protein